jgi:hypothetical protein
VKSCLPIKGIKVFSFKEDNSDKPAKTIANVSFYKGYKVTTTYNLISEEEMERLRKLIAGMIG